MVIAPKTDHTPNLFVASRPYGYTLSSKGCQMAMSERNANTAATIQQQSLRKSSLLGKNKASTIQQQSLRKKTKHQQYNSQQQSLRKSPFLGKKQSFNNTTAIIAEIYFIGQKQSFNNTTAIFAEIFFFGRKQQWWQQRFADAQPNFDATFGTLFVICRCFPKQAETLNLFFSGTRQAKKFKNNMRIYRKYR